jgi:rod shape-determining protein MreB
MRAVRDSAFRAKASEVYLVLQSVAAAIGAGLPIEEPSGNMIVDIGGGTTDVAVLSLSGLVYSKTIKTAGDQMDNAIIQYIKKKYNILIGEAMAEKIKITIGSAYPMDEEMTMDLKGRDLVAGVPATLKVNDTEIREALSEVVNVIVETIKGALERTPPELAADLVDKGIMLAGGASQLKNLDKRLREETGIPVTLAENPSTAVVEGTGRLLTDLELLRKVALNR